VRTMAVLGSGGHTTEMVQLLRYLDFSAYRMTWVTAASDLTSVPKLKSVFSKQAKCSESEVFRKLRFEFSVIPRSREVKQSFLTSAVTTVVAFFFCIGVIMNKRPQLIFVNGPGTCVPVVMAALLMEFLFGWEVRIFFVESFCRTKSLSLTGKLLYPFADRFVVHWPELTEKWKKAEYFGVLL